MSQSPTTDTVPAGKSKASKPSKTRTAAPKAKSKVKGKAAEAAPESLAAAPAASTDAEAEQRHRLIAEAAYLRAERRGFEQGDPMQDWLEAEREVDQRLSG